jgi:ABC-type dipeptide/oligopeptide/nickel transport system permease subunit
MIPPSGAGDLDQPGLSRLGTMAEPVEAPPDSSSPLSAAHLLGCDNLGYQVGRLMIGGQTSLEVGFAAAIVAVLFGTLYGAFSGFVGGIVDSFLMRIVDAGQSILCELAT